MTEGLKFYWIFRVVIVYLITVYSAKGYTTPFYTTDANFDSCQNGDVLDNRSCECWCGYFGPYCEFSSNTSHPNYRDICAVDNPCYNGGSCYMGSKMCEPGCICPDYYIGPRCQMKTRTVSPSNENNDSQTSIVLYVYIFVLLMLVSMFIGCCCVLIYFGFKRKKNKMTSCEDDDGVMTLTDSALGRSPHRSWTDRIRTRNHPGRIGAPLTNTSVLMSESRALSDSLSTRCLPGGRSRTSSRPNSTIVSRTSSRPISTIGTIRSSPPAYSELSMSVNSNYLRGLSTARSARSIPSSLPPPYSSAPPSQYGTVSSSRRPPIFEDVCESIEHI